VSKSVDLPIYFFGEIGNLPFNKTLILCDTADTLKRIKNKDPERFKKNSHAD